MMVRHERAPDGRVASRNECQSPVDVGECGPFRLEHTASECVFAIRARCCDIVTRRFIHLRSTPQTVRRFRLRLSPTRGTYWSPLRLASSRSRSAMARSAERRTRSFTRWLSSLALSSLSIRPSRSQRASEYIVPSTGWIQRLTI